MVEQKWKEEEEWRSGERKAKRKREAVNGVLCIERINSQSCSSKSAHVGTNGYI